MVRLLAMLTPALCCSCNVQLAARSSSPTMQTSPFHQAEHISNSCAQMKDVANNAVQDLASRQQLQQDLDLDWAEPGSSAPDEAPDVCCCAMPSACAAGSRIARGTSPGTAAHQPTSLQSPPVVLQPSQNTSRKAAQAVHSIPRWSCFSTSVGWGFHRQMLLARRCTGRRRGCRQRWAARRATSCTSTGSRACSRTPAPRCRPASMPCAPSSASRWAGPPWSTHSRALLQQACANLHWPGESAAVAPQG